MGGRWSTGETLARPQRGRVPGKLTARHGVIRAQVEAMPDMTIAEFRAWLLAISVSHAVMWETLRRLELSLKKDPARCRRHVRM